jgi:hypothetical protein
MPRSREVTKGGWKHRSHVPRYLRLLELLPVIPVEAEVLVRDMQKFGYPGYTAKLLRYDMDKALGEGFLVASYLLYEPGGSRKPKLFARSRHGTAEQVGQTIYEIVNDLQGEATDGPTPMAEASYHAVGDASIA